MRPIRAQKARALVGLECVGTAVCGDGGRSGFARGHFVCASPVRRFSAAGATVVTLLRQVGRSEANDSQVLGLMFRSLWDSLRQSLKRFFCPDGRYELAGTAKLLLYLPQTVCAYRIEALGQVNKGHKRSLFCSWNFSLTDEVET